MDIAIDEERFPFYDGKGIENFVEHDGPCTATRRSNAVFDDVLECGVRV